MIRVLIVDDSPLVRRVLRELLSGDPAIEVVGEAGDGQEAIVQTSALRPDVVTMDVRMPVLDGLAATEHIMAYHPTRILAITSLVSHKEVDVGFRMLGAGALDVMDKPAALRGAGLERMRRELVERVKLLARVRVVTHLRGRRSRPVAAPPQPQPHSQPQPQRQPQPAPALLLPPSRELRGNEPVIVIGASTGGPKAVQTILSALPRLMRAPIIVVQHIAEGFVAGMTEWLAASSQLSISLARHGQRLQPGEVLVAPDGMQLLIDAERYVTLSSQPRTAQLPSVDVTMQSVAVALGPQVIGVLLTGMGRDGALGLAAIKRAGGHTIAQDEATSAIFGMPKAALELGAVSEMLPIDQIAPALLARLAIKVAARTPST